MDTHPRFKKYFHALPFALNTWYPKWISKANAIISSSRKIVDKWWNRSQKYGIGLSEKCQYKYYFGIFFIGTP